MRRLLSPALMAAMACGQPARAPLTPRPMGIAADPTEYAAYHGGAGELAGQAFLTTRGGDVKLAAGRLVTLDPATTFAREWFRRFGADADRFDLLPDDSLFRAARRTTVANAEGRFKFTGLAPGQYILRSTVTWETGSTYAGTQGGVVASLVTVGSGPAPETILNSVVTPNSAATLGVVFVSAPELANRKHETLARVSGTSCQTSLLLDPSPSEEAARADLVVQAARKGADAVSNVECAHRGVSLRSNCTRRVVCDGDAVRWLP